MITAPPDTTLDELRAMLDIKGIITNHGALWRRLGKMGRRLAQDLVRPTPG